MQWDRRHSEPITAADKIYRHDAQPLGFSKEPDLPGDVGVILWRDREGTSYTASVFDFTGRSAAALIELFEARNEELIEWIRQSDVLRRVAVLVAHYIAARFNSDALVDLVQSLPEIAAYHLEDEAPHVPSVAETSIIGNITETRYDEG